MNTSIDPAYMTLRQLTGKERERIKRKTKDVFLLAGKNSIKTWLCIKGRSISQRTELV